MTKLVNVEAITSRHGKTNYYYRKGKGKRFRIHSTPGKGDFEFEYRKAVAASLATPTFAKELSGISAEDRRDVLRMAMKRMKNARSRDNKRGRVCDLTPEWLETELRKQDYRCAITNIPFLHSREKRRINPFSPSIDRIDSKKGYTRDNVRVVIFAVNMMMLDWGLEVFDFVTRSYFQREISLHQKASAGEIPELPMDSSVIFGIGGPASSTASLFPRVSVKTGVGKMTHVPIEKPKGASHT